MKKTSIYFLINFFLVAVVFFSVSHYKTLANYTAEPINITPVPVFNVGSIKLAAHKNGNTYIAWQIYNNSVENKFIVGLQLLDANGNKKWDDNGLIISETDASNISFEDDIHLLVSEEGDAIISIIENQESMRRSITIYKINSEKEFVWGKSGKTIFQSETESASRPNSMALAQNGNLLVTTTTDINTYITILSPEANELLPAPIKLEKINSQPVVVPGDDNKLFIIYKISGALYANMYNFEGAVLAQGVYLGDKTGENIKPTDKYIAYPDGKGGVIVCWEYPDGEQKSIILQRLNNSCERVFGDDGLDIGVSEGVNSSPILTIDTNNSMIYLAFASSSLNKKTLYLQCVNYEGEKLYKSPGIAFTEKFDESINNKPVAIAYTPNEKIIIIWRAKDLTNHTDELHAARIGTLLQEIEWKTIFNKESDLKTNFVYTNFFADQVVVAWSSEDIYLDALENKSIKIQNISYNGILGEDDSNILESQNKNNLFVSYPNPANNAINIKFNIPVANIISATLHDSNGKILNTGHSAYYISGDNLLYFRTDNLSSGTYFINILLDSEQTILKFIKE